MKYEYSKTPINKFIGLYKESKDVKNNFTHYAISVQHVEYLESYITSLEDEITLLKNNIVSLKNEYEINLSNLKDEYNHKIQELKNLHNQKIYDLHSVIDEHKKELTKVNSLNSNLLRISRERANQERNLRPKKAHKGFVVLNRQSLYYKLYSNVKHSSKTNQPNYIEFSCFKIKIQTPFDASISFNLIEDEIIDAFSDFVKDLKIDNWYNYNYIINQPISKIKDIIFNSEYNNFIFKYSYTANSKYNLWDIDIFTKSDIIEIK